MTVIEAALVFPLPYDGGAHRRSVEVPAPRIFRPRGLWVWGADESTLIHRLQVGNQLCFNVGAVALPALFFEAGLSFDDFNALVDSAPIEGSTLHELRKKLHVSPHQLMSAPTCEVGNTLLLDVEGPLDHAVLWGHTIL